MKASTTGAARSACRSRSCRSLIRDVPKPVIARVQGFAIGGGNVLRDALRPDASPPRRPCFGQVGPEGRLGRSGLRHRLPGARRRREEGARDLVPLPPLQRPPRRSRWAWSTPSCRTTSSTPRSQSGAPRSCERSPTAIAIAKRSFNADTEQHPRHRRPRHAGALELYYATEESQGRRRAPSTRSASREFRKFAK